MISFVRRLLDRLQTRKTEAGRVFVLDYRHKDYAALGRSTETLRNPYTVGWPEEGRKTTSRAEAEQWVRRFYAKKIERELEVAKALAARDAGPLRVSAACDAYLVAERSIPGHSRHTVKNRASIIEAHIKPKLGHLPLEALDDASVHRFLEQVRVWRQDAEGDWVLAPASHAYKRALRACLRAVWRANLPDIAPPFEGTLLRGPQRSGERRQAAFAGDFELLFQPRSGAQTPDQLRRSLIAALWYDRDRIAGRRNTSHWAVANTAAAMAFEVATGVRAEELVLLRWWCIKREEGVIAVPGTKSDAAVRYVPLMEALVPWIDRLEAQARPSEAPPDWRPDPMAFVFVTNARARSEMGRVRTLTNRISKALQFAGTKTRGKAQHWARATFATLTEAKLAEGKLKKYLGHEKALGGATDVYVEPRIQDVPPEHRALATHLPSPEELEAELEHFEPRELPKPRAGRRKRPRKGGHYSSTNGGVASA